MDLEQLPATPADARGLTIELVEGPGSAPGLAIRKWTNHGLVAGTHHLVAPSRAALSAPPAGDAAVAWRALTEIADRPFIKEPKQGDYGKDRERCPSCGHAWHVGETPHHAPACDRMIAVAARREMAFAALTAPTTPEGPSFLGHLVERSGGERQFVPAGQPLRLPAGRGKVTPVYDGPQTVTATPDGLREAVRAAWIAGATSVHEHWCDNPGEAPAPRDAPEFGEAADDYTAHVLPGIQLNGGEG